jgi:hypothetical protein
MKIQDLLNKDTPPTKSMNIPGASTQATHTIFEKVESTLVDQIREACL